MGDFGLRAATAWLLWFKLSGGGHKRGWSNVARYFWFKVKGCRRGAIYFS